MAKNTNKVVESVGKPPAAGMGRKKGVQNKNTKLLKDAILLAAEGAGGKEGLVGYLKTQAIVNPGPFLALLGKVLPLQVKLADETDEPKVVNLEPQAALLAQLEQHVSPEDGERVH